MKASPAEIKNYEFKKGLPVEFEIVSLKKLFKIHKKILIRAHRTGFYHILWFQQGNPVHLVDFNPVQVQPQTILFLNKDTVQKFDSGGDYDGFAILFTDNFYCKSEFEIRYLRSSILFNDLYTVSQISVRDKEAPFLELFGAMQSEIKNKKDNYQQDILQNLLSAFLLLCERERGRQDFRKIRKGPDLDYILLFRELLETQFRSEKQVSEYAKQLHVTEKRLNQATSGILGKSPKQMIDDRVMLEAKRLLTHTHESVKEIGYLLGFEEPTNFIKYFRKHSDSTPVEFREHYS